MSKSLALTVVFVFLACSLLTGCGPAPATPPPATDPVPPTSAPVTAPPAPSETATVSTPAVEPTADPTATFSPEIVATRPEDIAGVWLVKRFVALGGQVVYAARLTFLEDGTFSFDNITDGMHILSGTLLLGEGHVTLDSDECWDEVRGIPSIVRYRSRSTPNPRRGSRCGSGLSRPVARGCSLTTSTDGV